MSTNLRIYLNEALESLDKAQRVLSATAKEQVELTQLRVDLGIAAKMHDQAQQMVSSAFERMKNLSKRLDPKEQELMGMPTADLQMSIRARNCLTSENIYTVGELIELKRSDLTKIPNLGKSSLREIDEALSKLNLTVKPG